MKIKLTKLSSCAMPRYETPPMEGYVAGADNGPVSVPIDYWIEGVLFNKIEIGMPVLVERMIRNGISCFGIFSTSKVTKINFPQTEEEVKKFTFETLNSVYQVELLDIN